MGLCFVKAPPLPPAPEGGFGQSDTLRAILAVGAEEQLASPPPSIDLASPAGAGSTSIGGAIFGELMRAAFAHFTTKYRHCNKINVFPVPDGDTGNNMIITLKRAVRALGAAPPGALGEAADVIASNAALASQGNSGTILAFMLNELAAQVRSLGKDEISVPEFATALRAVGSKMNDSVASPVPGTLVSVIRDTFSVACPDDATVASVVGSMRAEAAASLQRTPDQLVVNGRHVLRDAGVVDSGAQGFVYLVDGMDMALRGELEYGSYMEAVSGTVAGMKAVEGKMGDEEAKSGAIAASAHDYHAHGPGCGVEFAFCTECIAEVADGVAKEQIVATLAEPLRQQGKSSSAAAVGPAAASLGDSVAVTMSSLRGAGGESTTIAKLHIHSNDPAEVFRRMAGLTRDGHLYKEKAEDMRTQIEAVQRPRNIPSVQDLENKCGILFDSTADLPEAFLDQWRSCMVPLCTVVDATSYRDRVDIDARTLSNIIRRRNYETVGTSGASYEDFKTFIAAALGRHRTVLIITLPKIVSGATYNNLQRALAELSDADRQRIVHWSPIFTVLPGYLVMRAFWLAHTSDKAAADIARELQAWYVQPGVASLTLIKQIGFIRRIGRFDHLMGKLCGIVGKVIISHEIKGHNLAGLQTGRKEDPRKPGTSKLQVKALAAPAKAQAKGMRALLKEMSKFKGSGPFDIQISHMCEPWRIHWFIDGMRAAMGDRLRHVYTAEESCILVAGAGPGSFRCHVWPAGDWDFPYK